MSMSERSLREQALMDHGKVYKRWHARRKRYSPIFESPNTLNAQNSFPFGAISSFLFKNSDNPLLQVADSIDRFLSTHISWLHPRFRAAILISRKA